MTRTATHPDEVDLDWLRTTTRATITRTEVAELLGIDPRTVTAGIDDGSIPSIRVGRRILIPRLPLLALLGAGPLEAATTNGAA